MKSLLFVCLFSFDLIADDEQPLNATIELYVFTKNIPNGTPLYTFTMTSVSSVWDNFYTVTTNYLNSEYTPSEHNQISSNYSGWDFVYSQNWLGAPVVAYGIYKFQCVELGFSFYLDLRDTSYRTQCPGQCDFWIWYDGNSEKFFISTEPYNFSDSTEIQNGNYLTVWGLKGLSGPYTNTFQNYWNNCLAVIPQYNQDNILSPYLVWGPIPNFSATGYKIYRCIKPTGNPPGIFTLLATISANNFTYLDDPLVIGNGKVVYYKVVAYNESTESGFSNIDDINVSGFYKNESDKRKIQHVFNIEQNFPNPFNRSTKIRFSISEDCHVTVTILNILGQRLKILFDNYHIKGNYELSFKADDLPTGFYWYTFQTNNTIVYKKMLYLK